MYTEHFGLNEKPFSISPDPRYLYLSHRHADALAHLLYGVAESGGFIQLTGEVGTGKTTLIRSLLGQLPDGAEIALILNPQLSSKQFLQAICQELHVAFSQRDTARNLIDRLNERLLALHAANRRVVLIVDEAQTMSPPLLEQVRLLTNLETARRKLLQIILIGQPELREVLAQPGMRQIAQRITGRYHLEPLDASDLSAYVNHRIRVAGGRPDLFSKRALRRLHRLARGIPRLTNIIADRALLAAYTRDETRVGAGLVRRAAAEVFGHTRALRWRPWAAGAVGIALLLWVRAAIDPGEQAGLQLAAVATPQPESRERIVDRRDEPPPDPLPALLATGDPASATAALFGLWNAGEIAGREGSCDEIRARDLRCLALADTTFGELRRLNRPARLQLLDAAGVPRYLLLTGIDDSHAAVVIGGVEHVVAVASLKRFPLGEVLLLWRPAVSGQNLLMAGDRGPGVIWLRTALESVAGIVIEAAEPALFDAVLGDAVRDYQHARELLVDGIAGERTLIHLQTDIGLVAVPLATPVR